MKTSTVFLEDYDIHFEAVLELRFQKKRDNSENVKRVRRCVWSSDIRTTRCGLKFAHFPQLFSNSKEEVFFLSKVMWEYFGILLGITARVHSVFLEFILKLTLLLKIFAF